MKTVLLILLIISFLSLSFSKTTELFKTSSGSCSKKYRACLQKCTDKSKCDCKNNLQMCNSKKRTAKINSAYKKLTDKINELQNIKAFCAANKQNVIAQMKIVDDNFKNEELKPFFNDISGNGNKMIDSINEILQVFDMLNKSGNSFLNPKDIPEEIRQDFFKALYYAMNNDVENITKLPSIENDGIMKLFKSIYYDILQLDNTIYELKTKVNKLTRLLS